MTSSHKFWNQPTPQKGPDVPYQKETPSAPVLRGFVIAPLAIFIRSSTWLQGILWKSNKFEELKDIPNLNTYTPRYDPTVVPIREHTDGEPNIPDLPQPEPRKLASQYYTCADYHKLYTSKKLTPVQVAEYLISKISRASNDQPPDKYSVAFIETKAELVLAAARASSERYERGQPLSVLDGVPVAVKDELEIEGYSKMEGSNIKFTGKHLETGWCVRQWQEAGAMIIGRTNMHEMGLGTTGFNSVWGTPLNPHNEAYYTGGSSSGSACAVAQGICPIALGADGGGSIRLPSSFCGVYGLKPSHSRISGRPTKSLATSVGVYGPIASSVDDLALAYRIMAEPDFEGGLSGLFLGGRKEAVERKVTQKVLGIDRAWVNRSDPLVLKLFEEAVQYYSKTKGYKVVDISIPYLPEGQKAHAMTIISEIGAGITPAQIPLLDYHNQALLTAAGSYASAQDFLAAQRVRALLMQHLTWLWEQYPDLLILTPTTPFAGWKIGQPSDVAFRSYGSVDSEMFSRSMEYVSFANFMGTPALSMPMGYTDAYVPIGLMALGEWGSEEQLLAWAKEGEDIVPGGIHRPQHESNWLDVLEETQRT